MFKNQYIKLYKYTCIVLFIFVHIITYMCLFKFKIVSQVLFLLMFILNTYILYILLHAIRILQQKVYIDPLTLAYNRTYFIDYMSSLFTKNTCIFMIDIDDFKNVNDVYGHMTGDKILTEITSILKDETKGFGKVIRWGGDEFVVILEKTDNYYDIAENIRSRIATYDFYNDGDGTDVTISIGITPLECIIRTNSMNTIIEIVDKALYEAKSYKNCIKENKG